MAVGFGVLGLARLASRSDTGEAHLAARRIAIAAALLTAIALLFGLPAAWDAGRLLGTAIGLLALVALDPLRFATTHWSGILLLGTAAAAFGVSWLGMTIALQYAEPSGSGLVEVTASAIPYAALLAVPSLTARRTIGVDGDGASHTGAASSTAPADDRPS